jgi:hypothetical protein
LKTLRTEAAKRMRDIAAGLTDSADIKAAEDYAAELEQAVATEPAASTDSVLFSGSDKPDVAKASHHGSIVRTEKTE